MSLFQVTFHGVTVPTVRGLSKPCRAFWPSTGRTWTFWRSWRAWTRRWHMNTSLERERSSWTRRNRSRASRPCLPRRFALSQNKSALIKLTVIKGVYILHFKFTHERTFEIWITKLVLATKYCCFFARCSNGQYLKLYLVGGKVILKVVIYSTEVIWILSLTLNKRHHVLVFLTLIQ